MPVPTPQPLRMDKEDRDLLIRIDERVRAIKANTEVLRLADERRNGRIENLESIQDKIIGAIILANVVIIPAILILFARGV